MIALLTLLGVGLVAGLVGAIGDDDDGETASAEEFTEEADGVVAQEYSGDLEAFYDDLVAEGEVSEAEALEILGSVEFRAGALNISTGGGDDDIVGSSKSDTIDAGAGLDIVLAGRGADVVDLGPDSDVYGVFNGNIVRPDDLEPFPVDFAPVGTEAQLEGGNDTVFGGTGNDYIADGRGSNTLDGGAGDDAIISVDQGALRPDVVSGGAGDDVFIVDEGDAVSTGIGADRVTVDVFDGVADGYDLVTISDFDPANDVLELEGNGADLLTPAPGGPGDMPVNPLSLAPNAAGNGVIVSVGGVPAVNVIGGQSLTLSDILISV